AAQGVVGDGDEVGGVAAVFEAVDVAGHAVADGEFGVGVGGGGFGGAVGFGAGEVEHRVDVAGAGVAELGDAGARLGQAADCGAFGDDARVVAGVGGDGDGGDAVVEVEGGDGAFAALDEFGVDGDGGDGFVVAVHVEDGVVDDLVGGPVEVGCGEVVGGVVDGVAGEEHGADDDLFGGDVVGGFGGGVGVDGGEVASFLGGVHEASFRWAAQNGQRSTGRVCASQSSVRVGRVRRRWLARCWVRVPLVAAVVSQAVRWSMRCSWVRRSRRAAASSGVASVWARMISTGVRAVFLFLFFFSSSSSRGPLGSGVVSRARAEEER